MNRQPPLDVREAELAEILAILHAHVPERGAWAFGSRTRRTAKKFSDLYLAVIGDQPMTLDASAALDEAFAESDLPWKVDVVDWARASESFREIVARDRIVIQFAADDAGTESPLRRDTERPAGA